MRANIVTALEVFSDDFGVRMNKIPLNVNKSIAMKGKDEKISLVGTWSATLGPGAIGLDPE